MTSAEAGTTRDSISVEINWKGREFRVFDTAGLRRRARGSRRSWKSCRSRTRLRAVRFAEVVVLMMDAQNKFEEQDLRIADLIEREGRALVIAVNKWDLMAGKPGQISALRTDADHLLPQVTGVPIVAVSGLMGEGIDRLMEAIEQAYAVWNRRVPTSAAQSLVRAGGRCQSAAGGIGPAAEAELHHPGQGAAAELRAVLLARRRGAAILSALSRQFPARVLRTAGHAGADHAAREGQSVRAQAQAAVVSEGASEGVVEAMSGAHARAAVAFIFVTILLDMLALGLIMPILPKLVESFVDNDTASAARIFGLFGTAWALMQFFFSPILGEPVGPVRPAAGGAVVEFRARGSITC